MQPSSSVSFADCVAKLKARGGGWCEIAGATIRDVYPPLGRDDYAHGILGPDGVISAWNGAAWDSERRKMYFHGGGHADYGGNEVYEWDLATATFKRLTDPSPYHPPPADGTCPYPVTGPLPAHTYDGIEFSAATQTIFVFPSGGFSMGCLGGEWGDGLVWEFNPGAEIRNGLAPLTWRSLSKAPVDGKYLRSVELPDGRFLVTDPGKSAYYDPRADTWSALCCGRADFGPGTAIYDPANDLIVEAAYGWVIKQKPGQSPERVAEAPFGIGYTSGGLAVRDDEGGGHYYFWSGGKDVYDLDIETGKVRVARHATGPAPFQNASVMSKWAWADGAAIGYANPGQGMWVWVPPSPETWVEARAEAAQSYIDAAAEGSTVTVPPGLYAAGILIDKDLTVDLAGVAFRQPVQGKALVYIANPARQVTATIRNYDMDGPGLGNISGIRADYRFDLTVRGFRIRGTNMGVLTSNHAGRLVLEDGTIEDLGGGSELSHGIYKGEGGSLVVRRVTVRNLRGYGHLVKSRADDTLIEDSRLLGLDGRYSSEIDIPNGGTATIRRNTIQKGPNTDNAQMLNVGTEGNVPPGIRAARLTFENNWVIFDRRHAPPEPSWMAGYNYFGKWRVPAGSMESGDSRFTVTGNRIVGMDGGWLEFPDLSAENRMFKDRNAAGLGPAEIPAP